MFQEDKHMMQFIPTHPTDNPHLADDAVHNAEIREITDRVYNIDSRLIHVLFWLPDVEKHLCTCFFFPGGFSIRSQQRLWHLCRAVGLELHDVIEHPEKFEGKQLRIKTYRASGESSSGDTSYSDVEMFLPSSVCVSSASKIQSEQLPF